MTWIATAHHGSWCRHWYSPTRIWPAVAPTEHQAMVAVRGGRERIRAIVHRKTARRRVKAAATRTWR